MKNFYERVLGTAGSLSFNPPPPIGFKFLTYLLFNNLCHRFRQVNIMNINKLMPAVVLTWECMPDWIQIWNLKMLSPARTSFSGNS